MKYEVLQMQMHLFHTLCEGHVLFESSDYTRAHAISPTLVVICNLNIHNNENNQASFLSCIINMLYDKTIGFHTKLISAFHKWCNVHSK